MTVAPVRLLLLEDNPADAELLQFALADFSPVEFVVTHVRRLADALVQIGSEHFDAVLCDLGLLDSSGIATARAIAVRFPNLPLVVLTGAPDDDLGRAAIEHGAQDYLVKGQSDGALIARALRYAIERKRLERGLRAADEALERRVGERAAELETTVSELRESMLRARALSETTIDAIIIADQAGIIIGWNPAAERLFGYPGAEAVGQALTLVIPERYRGDHLIGVKRFRAGGERHLIGRRVELYGLTKAGAEFPIELSLSTWESSNGSVFAGIIRDISERTRAERALTRQKDLYDMLSQTNQTIVRGLSVEDLFRAVCRIAVDHGRFRFAWIGLLEADRRTLQAIASHGDDAGYVSEVRISADASVPGGRGIIGHVLRTGRRDYTNDMFAGGRHAVWHEAARRAGVRALVSLPLRRSGVVIGAITLYSSESGFFTEDLLATLDEMALDVSFALDNIEREAERKRAEAALAVKTELLRATFENIGQGISLVDRDLRVMGWNRRFLELLDLPESLIHEGTTAEDILRFNALRGEYGPGDPEAQVRKRIEQMRRLDGYQEERVRPDGTVLEMRRSPIPGGGTVTTYSDITERKRAEEVLRAAEEQFRGLVEQSIAGIYIIQDGKFAYVNPRYAEIRGYGSADELIGLDNLSVIAEKDRELAAENIRRMSAGDTGIMNYGITALCKDGSTVEIGVHGARATYKGRPAIIGMVQDISEKKRAEEQIRRYVVQLEKAFMSTVGVATTLSEMRDPYTAGHERRVAEIAVVIGAALGFDARGQEGLRVAGYLHDVGKITIPSEILSKPGKLSPIEFRLIQGHAQASYDVLKDVEFPWPVAEVALQHHERVDGSGYPQGLKGEAILLEARIMAVADVVEAMASHRPYRVGLGIDKALAEIERGRGTAYDTVVADACLKLFRKQGYAIPA